AAPSRPRFLGSSSRLGFSAQPSSSPRFSEHDKYFIFSIYRQYIQLVHVWNIFRASGVNHGNERTYIMATLETTRRQKSEQHQKDELLLTRLKSGEDGALGDLIDAYGTKIYQLAFRYLRNKEDAEEIAQDVLFKVYRKVGSFRGDSALSSWIYRITFNAAMSRLRTAEYQNTHPQVSLETDA